MSKVCNILLEIKKTYANFTACNMRIYLFSVSYMQIFKFFLSLRRDESSLCLLVVVKHVESLQSKGMHKLMQNINHLNDKSKNPRLISYFLNYLRKITKHIISMNHSRMFSTRIKMMLKKFLVTFQSHITPNKRIPVMMRRNLIHFYMLFVQFRKIKDNPHVNDLITLI